MRAAQKRPDHIKIPEHLSRRDFGDIAGLARSIGLLGQLQPVGVDKNDTLVFGSRRLQAIKDAGREWIDCVVLEDAHDMATALQMERAENDDRKDLTPSEKVDLGRKIELALAAGRKEVPVPKGGLKPGTETINIPVEKDADIPSPFGKEARQAAAGVGMSPRTYQKAKEVVDAAAADPAMFGETKATMDKTGEVAPAHREMTGRKSKAESLKDNNGVEIPMRLRDIFGDRRWLIEAAESLAQISRDLTNTAKAIDGKSPAYKPWMKPDSMLRLLKDGIEASNAVRDMIFVGTPFAVCQECRGKGKSADGHDCMDCHGSGWLNSERHAELYDDSLPT